jgi:NTE family protein
LTDGTVRGETAPRLALVLGAGGARGFAHVGALKVIERHRIPIDLVVGSSMGSLIGAGFAAGTPAASMEAAAREVNFARLFRPRPSRRAFVDPSGIHGLVRRLIGGRRFRDLDRELAILTASLGTGQPIVVRDGSVADAVLASIAIPLVLPPVPLGDDHCVDGGMIDGLPVRLARQLGARTVIAVDADNHARRLLRAPGLRQATHWVADLLAGRPTLTAPGARQILSRMLHHVARRSAFEEPDVLIRPRFGRLTSFHYHRWERCMRLGEEAARASLTEVLAACGQVAGPTPRCPRPGDRADVLGLHDLRAAPTGRADVPVIGLP